MKIRKLNWAGLHLQCGDISVLIDAVENFKPYLPVLGKPLTPLVQFTGTTKADYILFTHLHLDHLDTGVIENCLNPTGKIIGYKKLEKEIAALNRPYILLDTDQTFEENNLQFKAVFSLDGVGEEPTEIGRASCRE